jgi:spermidine synthase
LKVESNIKSKNSLLFAAIGFFTLASQTLVFRVCLRVFEGSEFCTGLFFFTWLFWGAVGAGIFHLIPARLNRLCKPVTPALLYPAGCLIQMLLLIRARSLWGVPEYELFSIKYLFLTILVFNAPVSILTGYLFARTSQLTSPGELYRFEALGSFAGTIIITILLGFGLPDAAVFAGLGLAYLLLLWPVIPPRMLYRIMAKNMLAAVALGGGFLLDYENMASWQRFLPNTKIKGTFQTSQASYAYGRRDGDFIVSRWNSICTTLPGRAYITAALCLAQKPDARRILLVGDGDSASLALELCKLPQVSKACWISSDPGYPTKLFRVAPREFRPRDNLTTINIDAREYLKNCKAIYDLIIVQPPAMTSLATNRFYSLEFFKLLKTKMADKGVMGISFAGGENFLSKEQKHFGAGLIITLSTVFSKTILRPGEHSWLFAAGKPQVLTSNPDLMEKRLQKVAGLSKRFPPEGIHSVFESFRAKMQLQEYYDYMKENKIKLSINTDYSPRLFLDAMTNYLKRLGQNIPDDFITTLKKSFFYAGFMLFPLLLILDNILRLSLRKRTCDKNSGAAMLTVFLTSITAMIWCISAMFVFQMRFGSLFLWFGMLNAAFMLGLYGGGTFALKHDFLRFPVAGLLYCLIVALTLPLTMFMPTPWLFTPFFAMVGFAAGVFLPLGGKILGEKHGGALLEALDCSGGAIGAILAGLLLLPLFGPYKAVLISLPLIAVWALRQWQPPKGISRNKYRAVVFILGLAIWLALCFPVNAAALKVSRTRLKALGARSLKAIPATVKGKNVLRLTTSNGKPQGWIFRSGDFLKKHPKGYAGPIHMLIRISSTGVIKNFIITSHKETPRYLIRAMHCRLKLIGSRISADSKLPQIDAVSGATPTSEAIIETVLQSVKNFAIATNIKTLKKPVKHKTIIPRQPFFEKSSTAPPPAKVRKIDETKYKRLIKQGKLSNKKAMYQTPKYTK